MIASQNLTEKNMGIKMKEKFDKYWGDPEKMNLVIFFANVLDPRDKVDFMPPQFCTLFGEERGEACFRKVKTQLASLFEDYLQEFSVPSRSQTQTQTQSQSQSQSQSRQGLPPLGKESKYKSFLKKQRAESGTADRKMNELDVYLGEQTVDDNGLEFDLLKWWKINSVRFPILSKVAREVLAVPISTVASESTFSTSGRVFDNFRSSLTPKIVEALICTQDWLRGPIEPVAVEENIEDLEKFEKEMENLRLGTSSARGTEDTTQASNDLNEFEVDS